MAFPKFTGMDVQGVGSVHFGDIQGFDALGIEWQARTDANSDAVHLIGRVHAKVTPQNALSSLDRVIKNGVFLENLIERLREAQESGASQFDAGALLKFIEGRNK